MTEWKEYKLGEIAEITSSKRIFYSEYVSGGVPFYRSKEIIDLYNKRNVATELYISLERYNEIKDKFGVPQKDDILLTSVGSLGIPYKVKDEDYFYFKDGNLTWFKDININIIYPDYFVFWLTSCIGKQKLDEITIGSTQAALTISGLKTVVIELPPLPEQIRIASILSSLDDKIDLLHCENKTLEAMAETLFRQWFIEEAKEDWEEGKLGDYVELVNGVSYKGDELQPSNVAMVTLKSFDRNGGFRMDGYKEFTGKFKKEQVLYDGDLVVAHTDITQEADVIGNPVIVIGKNQYETITFSMDVVKVVSKSEFFSNSFLYYLMKTQAFKEHCLGYANGSTVLHLSKKAIPEFEFHIPPKIIAQSFQKQVESINKKILNNNNEIQTLIQMRDGLLPKLMSGEVKI
ncbi:MAG: restriction endonuclease subunit S [Bacteroidales bacterium]|nr:restriction endonuclease subunit S [Bacteroidales bacterium]